MKIFFIIKRIFKRKKRNGEINPEDILLDSSNLIGLDLDKEESAINKPISHFMEYVPAIFIGLIFSLFVYRMYSLQVQDYASYKEKSENNKYNSNLILANRGQIYDRNGNILAKNVTSASSTNILKRLYIEEPGFSSLLGYITYPQMDENGYYWQDSYVGKNGVESVYQDLLTGVNGKQIVEKDVKSSVESQNVIEKPVPGVNLYLTIDENLQEQLYNSLAAEVTDRNFTSGAGIIMNPNNGQILAIVTFPDYDNNLMTNASTSEDNKKIKDLLSDPRAPFLNRAISGLFTPGSVVKPFMAYGALNEGIITPEKKILSVGQITIPNPYGGPDTVFRDWEAHGWINVVRALAESSDEFFYQVGGGYKDQPGLGITGIDKYANLFGLSTTTNIDLPGEETGVIPSPEWKRIHFLDSTWRLGDTYHTAIGQYGFQVTPIELIRYIAAIANDGKLVTPHVFLAASSTSELADQTKIDKYNAQTWPIEDLNLNKYALKYVQEGMREVVEPGGTEPSLDVPGLNVAAKSGTAEIGVVKGKVNSLITGYFPFDDPQYAFAVVVENGVFGSPSPGAEVIKPVLEYIEQNKDKYLKSDPTL